MSFSLIQLQALEHINFLHRLTFLIDVALLAYFFKIYDDVIWYCRCETLLLVTYYNLANEKLFLLMIQTYSINHL